MIHDVVVVGAGIWGASAVEAYDRAGCSVAWISDDDPEHPTAASADIVRIVRAEYADPAYRQFAQTCLDAFQTEDPYRRYFHRSGWFLLQDEEQARRGSIPRGTERVSADEFQHVFPNAHVENNLLITRADNVGWVEANNLQRALLAQSRVKPRRGTVTSLILEGAFCRGVRLGAKEEEVLGRTVILATGWRANELLATHNLLLVDCQIVGVPVLGVQLSEEQYSKYRKMPIICQPGKGKSNISLPIIVTKTCIRRDSASNPRADHESQYPSFLRPQVYRSSTQSSRPDTSLSQGQQEALGDLFSKLRGLSDRNLQNVLVRGCYWTFVRLY